MDGGIAGTARLVATVPGIGYNYAYIQLVEQDVHRVVR